MVSQKSFDNDYAWKLDVVVVNIVEVSRMALW